MPRAVAENYARRTLSLEGSADRASVLASYGGGDATTMSPYDLPTFFPERQFDRGRFHGFDKPTGYRVDPERDAVWE